jgi:hypothetical protein
MKEAQAAYVEKKENMERMGSLLSHYPQVFKAGIGAEAFVEDFIKAFTKYSEYSGAEKGSINFLLKEMVNFPQIVRPEGAEAFVEDFRKAAVKFYKHFGEERNQ